MPPHNLDAMKKLLITATLAVVSLSANAAEVQVVASTPRGGVVRFTGLFVGDAVFVAQRHCFKLGLNAVPLGFFPSGPEQLMTFECVK